MQQESSDHDFTWTDVERLLTEFKRIARHALARERGRDLQTTDLMQTALRRMFQTDDGWDYERVWQNRRHVAAWFRTTVERALKDRRRARSAFKRSAPGKVVSLDELLEQPGGVERDPELLYDLCQSVERLAHTNPRAAELIPMSLVMGLSSAEIASILGVSERHSRRELAFALHALRKQLKDLA